MKRKVKKMCTGLVMSMAFVIATVGTVYGMTQYGHYDISTITETGIRAWAYKKSPYKSASAKVTEAGRSSGWKTGRDVKATLTNLPFYVSKTYYKYNIDSRKKEFYIRRIVGADKKQIMILFLLDYIGIMIISAILGIVLSFLFCLLPLSYSEGIWNVHKGTLGISVLSCLIPMLIGSVIVWRQQSVRNFE